MNGVFIEMAMPDKCLTCRFLDYDRGYRCAVDSHLIPEFRGARRKDCPLLPVPYHGKSFDIIIKNGTNDAIERGNDAIDR